MTGAPGGADGEPEAEPDPLRLRSLAETDGVLTAAAPRYGVARIADITRLDLLGLATATVIRRDPIGESVSVCSGKGASAREARVSALAEALERYCGEPRGRIAAVTARVDQLQGPYVPPDDLILPQSWDREAPIDWCHGARLDGARIWVPANAVLFPYLPAAGARPLFAAHTHGLAVGSTRSEAIAHGLLECIERDAYARAVALASVGRGAEVAVIDLGAGPGPAPGAAARLAALDRAGIQYLLRDVTGELGVPTILCTISDGELAHMGVAAHPRPAGALAAAIDEAAQSRLTDLQGAREDLPPRAVGAEVDRWFLEPGASPRRGLAAASLPVTVDALLAALQARLAGLEPAVVPVFVDLSLEGVAMAAVRVVTPGLEVWAHDPARIGPRARSWLTAR